MTREESKKGAGKMGENPTMANYKIDKKKPKGWD